jgi:allantoin racemase
MNILVVNPTSDMSLNDVIYKAADYAAKLSARNSEDYTHVSVVALEKAPKRIVSALDIIEASAALLEKIRSLKGIYDGFIIAHHTELGVAALSELTKKPVLSSGPAGVYPAPLYGKKIAVLGKTERDIEMQKETLRHYGILNDNMQFIATCAAGDASLDEMKKGIFAAAKKAKEEMNCEVIVLSDAGMSLCADEVAKKFKLPVLEGVTSAVIRIEYMVYQMSAISE